MAQAKKSFERYKTKVLKPGEKFDYENQQFLSKDNFFMEEDEEDEERAEEAPIQRLEVDKRGNVIKKRS